MRSTLILFTFLLSQNLFATSIDWSGGYRIEFNEIDRPTLSDAKERKAYGFNYLYLNPKIVASDGINIVGRFDIFSSEIDSYKNSQLGSVIGGGLRRAGTNNGPNVTAQNSEASTLRVSQLYLNVNQEFGSLVAGRAPVDFGLGITHNAGLGAFDHWYDTKDMIAYRFIVDNVSFMPLYGKVAQQDFGQGVTISDQAFVFEYDNKDNQAKAGIFYQIRNSSRESNDALTAPGISIPGGGLQEGPWTTKTVNLFFGRAWEAFEFKLEASFLTGETGITVAGENVKFNAYGIAAEVLFPAKDASKWEFNTKFGVASGDDPKTTGTIEGYQFDRNYDVAMLLFNHRMGQRDFLTTGITHTEAGLTVGNSADDESIGNTFYIAPSLKYQWNEKVDWKTTVIYAQTVVNPTNSVDFKNDLGTELDIELIYKPRERVTWSNQIGVLFPGQAWTDGASGLDNKTNYGISTKAAITF